MEKTKNIILSQDVRVTILYATQSCHNEGEQCKDARDIKGNWIWKTRRIRLVQTIRERGLLPGITSSPQLVSLKVFKLQELVKLREADLMDN